MNGTETLREALTGVIPGQRLLTGEPLSGHTTMRVGGPCDLMAVIHTEDELRGVLARCAQMGIVPTVMGNGSNLLVRDGGVRGLTIKIEREFGDISIQGNIITAQAGALLPTLAQRAMAASLSGLEFASGIPGTVGGAVKMNAGAYGGEMAQVVTRVDALSAAGEAVTLERGELGFGYRHSVFMERGLILTRVTMALTPGDREQIAGEMARLGALRREKQPLTLPSAGSVFKRPTGQFAGSLIENAGLKGRTVGGAQVSPMHAGFIVNNGGATARDVLRLIHLIQDKVLETSGVWLEPELHIIGEDER